MQAFYALSVSKKAWGIIGRAVIWGVFGAAGAGIAAAGSALALPIIIGAGAAGFDASMLSDIFTDWLGDLGGGGGGAQPAGPGGPGPTAGGGGSNEKELEVKTDDDQ
jgi:hypothetical protein